MLLIPVQISVQDMDPDLQVHTGVINKAINFTRVLPEESII